MNEKRPSPPPFSKAARSLSLGGLYEHYKGMRYRLLHIARHSETLEELVVYQALYGERGIWARPLKMFVEEILLKGEKVPRFRYIGFKDE